MSIRNLCLFLLVLIFSTLGFNCGGGGASSGASFSISPTAVTVSCGGTVQFRASSSNVGWEVSEQGGGYFGGAQGLYTAPAQPGVFHVVATNLSNTNQTASSIVTVVSAPVVSIVCPTVVNHDAQGVTASTSSISGCTYQWSLEGSSILSGQGTNTIGFNAPHSGTVVVHCMVTNAAASVATGSATIQVADAPTITSFRATPSIVQGGSAMQFLAVFSGATGSIDGIGSIQSGVPVDCVPNLTATYTLRVLNLAGEEIDQTCTVTVTAYVPPIHPLPMVVTGRSLPISAPVLGAVDQTITWTVQEGAAGGSCALTGQEWTYQAPATPGTYHLLAQPAADPSTFFIYPVTVFKPYSEFLSGGYSAVPFDPTAAQPVAFAWGRQSRFLGPHAPAGPRTLRTLNVGNVASELLLGPHGEFYTDGGQKWDSEGTLLPGFQPADGSIYSLLVGPGLDALGRVLVFDTTLGVDTLQALDQETGAVAWSVPFTGGVAGHLATAPDGRLAIYNTWDGSRGDDITIVSPAGAVQFTIPNQSPGYVWYVDMVFDPNGDLIVLGSDGVYKFDATGKQTWKFPTPPLSIKSDNQPHVVVATDGTIYAMTGDNWTGTSPAGVVAINNDGTLAWTTWFASGYRPGLALAQDGTLVCGLSGTSTPVVALNPDGSIKWQYTATGPLNLGAPLLDAQSYVYLASYPRVAGSQYLSDILALSPSGVPVWSKSLDVSNGNTVIPRLTLSPRNELLVTWFSGTCILAD